MISSSHKIDLTVALGMNLIAYPGPPSEGTEIVWIVHRRRMTGADVLGCLNCSGGLGKGQRATTIDSE